MNILCQTVPVSKKAGVPLIVGSSIASKHFVTGRNVIPAVADTTSLPGKKPLFKLPIWLFSLIAYAYRDEALNAFFFAREYVRSLY